jgi:hypothetical protein
MRIRVPISDYLAIASISGIEPIRKGKKQLNSDSSSLMMPSDKENENENDHGIMLEGLTLGMTHLEHLPTFFPNFTPGIFPFKYLFTIVFSRVVIVRNF